ncbi:MAG: helicase-related protein [Geodermatophilaceae bacterium]
MFVNSRRLAERLTSRLNELAAERAGVALEDPQQMPAQVMAQSGIGATQPEAFVPVAAAHHGSVSREQRAAVEEALKTGQLPAVVATSSLELGIDMGAVDLVIQVESPPTVASGLQRVGRAGHQVGAVSSGVLFPEVPRRPAADRRGGRADAGRSDRIAALSAQPIGRAGPADRRDGRPRPAHRRGDRGARTPGGALRRTP